MKRNKIAENHVSRPLPAEDMINYMYVGHPHANYDLAVN